MELTTRLQRIWRSFGAFGRRDPTLFLVMFAAWAGISGLSLIVTPDSFNLVPQFRVARDLHLNDDVVGLLMALDAVLILWGVGDRAPHVQTTIALMSGSMWFFWSFIVIAGGVRMGVAPNGSIWAILASAALVKISTRGWSIPNEREPPVFDYEEMDDA